MGKPLSPEDITILNKPVARIAAEVQSGQLDPLDVLSTYTRKAIRAHVATNCLTEILTSSAQRYARECSGKGPLAGVPISLKDVCAPSSDSISTPDEPFVDCRCPRLR
jgi:Asp-tRNA(Asn)/Glu-tRNA(Gln) amidotransferase A subunit family amidase